MRRCINSIAATVGMPFRICIGFGDDVLSQRFLPAYPYVTSTNFIPRGWYVRDTNRTFSFMKEVAPETDYFLITQNDTEFLRFGWGQALIDLLHRKFEDGMGVAEIFNPMGFSNIFGRAAVFDQFDGKILDEAYQHYFADSERRQQLIERGQFLGIEYGSPLEMLCHHPTYATTDPVGLDARLQWYDRDRKVFERRHAQDRS